MQTKPKKLKSHKITKTQCRSHKSDKSFPENEYMFIGASFEHIWDMSLMKPWYENWLVCNWHEKMGGDMEE